jgi:ubiquinone/menaquinone biosynthesis C-methylase UbiE
MAKPELKLLPIREYAGVNRNDPIHLYKYPLLGAMYRQRVEMCLDECRGGERVLEVGFGAGVTFLNLHELYEEIHGLDLTASVDDVSAVFAARQIATHLKRGNVLQMPYADDYFDTVLLISILEHLKPAEQEQAFSEMRRVLAPGGQVVYGVPIERRLLGVMFRVLGYSIRDLHFCTEKDVAAAAERALHKVRIVQMRSTPPIFGAVYEVGHFVKLAEFRAGGAARDHGA